nr:immunoglobulin heavy chain junction region [Mus musculus]MBK4184721.1 immunoglobulin heavy chain junction region [Mus musculus]
CARRHPAPYYFDYW